MHQIIHHIIISLLSIGIDYIVYKYNNFIIFDLSHIILFILYVVLLSINISYKKYLIEDKNYSVFSICTVFGFFNIIFYIILFIIKNIYNNPMCYNIICFNFFEYKFEGILSWIILFISLIVNSIHFYFFYSILYHFNSIYILIVLVVKRFYELFIQIVTSDNFSLYFLILYLVLSTFVMISFAFFLEVIEIKLFGLNKNIKKNIIEREEYDEDIEDED